MTLMAGIKIFGPENFFRYAFMTLLKFFSLQSFLCVNSNTGKLGLSQVSRFDSHDWNSDFWDSKFFVSYTFITLLKLFYFTIFSLVLKA